MWYELGLAGLCGKRCHLRQGPGGGLRGEARPQIFSSSCGCLGRTTFGQVPWSVGGGASFLDTGARIDT